MPTETEREISPIVYSISLWIISVCLLLSEVSLSIAFTYMLLTTPLMIFFVLPDAKVNDNDYLGAEE